MEFCIKEWRKYYDSVHKLGKMINDSQTDQWGNPPVHKLSRAVKVSLELEMALLMAKSDKYLDLCNFKPKPYPWIYHKEDTRTMASHEDFAYGHLI